MTKASDIANVSGLSPLARDYIDLRTQELVAPFETRLEGNRKGFVNSQLKVQEELAEIRAQLKAIARRLDKLETK